MPKRVSDDNDNPKPIHASSLSHKENTDRLIEDAAEQLADLLWKCWLASNNPRTEKRTKSDSRPDSLKSS